MGSTDSRSRSRSNSGAALYLGASLLLIVVIVGGAFWFSRPPGGGSAAASNEAFAQAMASGKTFYDKGDPAKAISAFQTALSMNPANPDAHLNLANAFLAANQPAQAAQHASEVLQFDPGSGAAHYILGCSLLRQNAYSNAVQSLEQAKAVDRSVNPVSFQLGRAFQGWGRNDEAAEQFREVLQFETNHPAANYLLSQVLLRLGQREAAAAALAEHQRIAAGKRQAADNPSVYERCKYTEIVAPFPLEQPGRDGVSVKFTESTDSVLGTGATAPRGAFGLMDINRRGWNDLLVAGPQGVQLWWNSNGVFRAKGAPLAVPAAVGASDVLIGDLQNDRYEDAVVVSTNGLTVLRFATNGVFNDATAFSGLRNAAAAGVSAALADLDFSGKLGLLLITADGHLRSFTNLGSGSFRERKFPDGGPTGLSRIVVDDWNNDDLPDVILPRPGAVPLVFGNVRTTGLVATNVPADWPAAAAVAVGDFNNDLRNDVALLAEKSIEVFFGGLREPLRLPAKGHHLRQLKACDYDNDGWLDLVAWGDDGVRVWRNRGNAGFHEVTAQLGLQVLAGQKVLQVAAADLDNDGDLDLVVGTPDRLRTFRNDGGNANTLLKLRLQGNRSNASALGVKVELSAGGWHGLRTVQSLPVEIGIGKRDRLDSVSIRWFDARQDDVEVVVNPREVRTVFEFILPTGSCPYLYVWNGQSNRFITDVLGAAPIGLPVAPGRLIEGDPDEQVGIGDDQEVPARQGRVDIRLTEELREVLYLDHARLLVADHPAGTEVHSTGRLVPGRPFPAKQLLEVSGRVPLRAAATLGGLDVTAALQQGDHDRVSPPQLLGTHYRGLAETHGVILNFGPLDSVAHPVLALTGWLRFGGGMANIAASHRGDLPFPFPVLEAETADGWKPVRVNLGAPAGKTKSYVVDLTGALPAGTRRLRLTAAFEIHWDRIALFSHAKPATVMALAPARSDLHWRGYSAFADLPSSEPLTPVYDRVTSKANWTITPSGWVTRYGSVDELIQSRDNGLAMIAGGDELALEFEVGGLKPHSGEIVRDYFLEVSGWDKDSDYHVVRGDQIQPLPWHGMDDQQYGVASRPSFPSDALHERFNTRWVGPKTFARRESGNGATPSARRQ
jgi:Tfp pilus assembly protein PilF